MHPASVPTSCGQPPYGGPPTTKQEGYGHTAEVILEHAVLPVVPGQEEAFEEAFSRAKAILASAPGFAGLTLSRCLERPGTYLLLVQWERLEDHTVGFRESDEYQDWRRLLHHFYDPFLVVEHYAQVQDA